MAIEMEFEVGYVTFSATYLRFTTLWLQQEILVKLKQESQIAVCTIV